MLNVGNAAAIAEFSKRDRQAVTPSAAGTANAMGVVLGLHRQAKVEHVGDGGYVNATGCHIGGYQNLDPTIAQCRQTAVAHTLAQGTMQSHCRKIGLLQIIGQVVALNLGACKHNGLVDAGIPQPMVQQRTFVFRRIGPVQALSDVGVFFLRCSDFHLFHMRAVVVHYAQSQLLNARGKRGTEHHGLTALLRQAVDFSQIVGEAQVQHPVSLIHDQELHFVQLDLSGTFQIQQTPRSSNHQVGVLQLGHLHLIRHATHNVGNPQATAMANEVDGVVGNLLGQLARGADHQRTRYRSLEVAWIRGVFTAWTLGHRLTTLGGFRSSLVKRFFFSFGRIHLQLQQRVQHRQQKCGCFTAASLTGNHQVRVTGAAGAT